MGGFGKVISLEQYGDIKVLIRQMFVENPTNMKRSIDEAPNFKVTSQVFHSKVYLPRFTI